MTETRIGNPIRSVHVLPTGTVRQHKEHRQGSRMPSMWWVLTSRSWIEAPINAYLIEHEDGLVLFDTGMDPAVVSDPGYFSSAAVRFFARRLFRFRMGPDEALGRRIEAAGFQPADISRVVVSHLHFDHIGGISDVPQAELLVSREEWQQLSGPHPERDFFLREHIELPGARWRQIDFQPSQDPLFAHFDGCFDVMGDGSMVALPTPGHTAGSLSMLVRSEGIRPILFVADLTYELEMLKRDRVPGTGDPEALRRSFSKVRHLMEQLPDLIVLAAHDPASAGALAASQRGYP